MKTGSTKWKTIIALILIYVAIIFNQYWIWAGLFMVWIFPGLLINEVYLVETIKREEQPLLFYWVTLTWIGFALYSIFLSFAPVETYQLLSSPKYKQHKTAIYFTPKNSVMSTHTITDTLAFEKKSIPYKEQFVGLSIQTTFQNDQYKKDIDQLWDKFYQEDFSSVYSRVVTKDIYVVYHTYHDFNFEVLIGFKVDTNNQNVHSNYSLLSVPAQHYAVFSSNSDTSSHFITETWEKILDSDLPLSKTMDMERYQFDPKNHTLKTAQIWAAIHQ